ncbi:MAG: hypothetical protein ACK2U9_16560 [Anaerolineae bacterium]
MNKSPYQIVKERFKDKESLAKTVRELASGDLWIDRLNDGKGLEMVSNRKLLHLHDLLTRVKERFGTRGKLIDALLQQDKRVKDQGYRTRLEKYGTPRLWEMLQAGEKRAKRAPADRSAAE